MIARLASIFVLSTFLFQTSHALESKCFSMQPKGSLNEKTCAPVPVTITYKDCDSGAAGSVVDGVARFECKGKVKRLKYWHDDAMLIGVLERSGSGYNVAKTFAQGGSLKPKATPAPIAEQTPVPTPMPTASIPVALNPLEATPTPATTVKSESVLNKIKWGGALDVQYNYNLGMPAPTAAPAAGTNAAPSGLNRYVQPGSHHDQFTLALAMVSAEKQAEPFGFKIDVGFGKAAEATAGTNNDASSRNVLQAYANYASEFGLEISMGKFFAPLGRESLYTPHNLNTSYSYIFSYLTPTWLVGAKATQNIGDIVAITGFVGNGSNVTYDNNKNKTFGGVVDFTPGFGIKAKAGFSGGNERADATGKDERSIMSGTLEYDLLEWGLLTMAADFAEASEAISDQPSQKARSTAVYGWLKAPFGFSIGARHEMYYDGVISFGALPGGFADTAAINQGGLNINATSAVLRFDDDGFSLRAEYRTDAANHPVFTKEDGATNNQNVVTVSSTFSF